MAADRPKEAPEARSASRAKGRAQPQLVGRDYEDRPGPGWGVTGREPSNPEIAVDHQQTKRPRFAPIRAEAADSEEPHRVFQPHPGRMEPKDWRCLGYILPWRPCKHACRAELSENGLNPNA